MNLYSILKKLSLAGIVLGIVISLTAWSPIRIIIFGTSGLTKENMPHLQVVIKTVDLYISPKGVHSAIIDTEPDNNTIYEICPLSINVLLVSEQNLKELEGKTAELWIDKNDRIMQIKSNGKEYINFDKAFTSQKIEDKVIFVFGLIMEIVGIVIIIFSSFLMLICRKGLRNNGNAKI